MIDPMRVGAGAARAVANARSHFLGEGVEPPHATASEVVSENPHARLVRFRPSSGPGRGEPILLVPPLAVPIACFDLRPQQSLAAFLIERTGRPVYVVDYGSIGFADRRLGFEAWIDGILPMTVRQVSYMHGGAPVDVVTWSLGGTLTLLTAAAHPRLPLRAIAAVGTPIDYSKVPHLVPLRQLGRVTGGQLVHTLNRALGGQPGVVVRAAFRFTALQRELTRPCFLLRNLHDTEAIARMESVDRFIGGMPGYPGRFYGQLYARAIQANELASGRLTLRDRGRDRVIDLGKVRQDVLIVAGRTDVIAPIASVKRAIDVLTGARSVNYAEAPGSHLGVLTGPEAAGTTWLAIDEFLARVASRRRPQPLAPR
ncbi:MAG: alpha/beta hydrolase [Jatrophihabitans sp.]|uniref:alpha/beta hydrolase n=1 Tax=Jatrophihabitans sp. TaxID=1932789 RepID=UPI003F7F058C